jgi:hypothetical protein
MKRHFAAPVVAVLAAGLLVTSCSGDGGSADGGIPGAGTEEKTPEAGNDEPEPTDEEPDPADDDIERPDIALPDEVINVFEEVETDDPVELAVLADQERYLNAVDEAVTSGGTDRPGHGFYADGDALISDLEYITGMHEDNLSFAGTTRYYNREVTVREEGVATTVYCMDLSGTHLFDVDSGERTADSGENFLYSSRLVKNELGVWQTVFYTSEKGAEECG